MPTTIKLKNSVTTTNAPSSLAQGEVAINVTDKKIWVGNAATTPVQLLGTGADGSFTNLAYTGTLTGGTGVVNLGSGQLIKDASGNLGLGVTPSAWSGFRALQIGSTTSLWSGTSGNSSSFYTNNGYFNGSNRIYLTNGFATEYIQGSGQHIWFNAPSGTAGNAITFTQAMTLADAGNLTLGSGSTSATGERFAAYGAAGTGGDVNMSVYDTTSGKSVKMLVTGTSYNYAGMGASEAVIYAYDTNITLCSDGAKAIKFATNASERMRIDSAGNVIIGGTAVPNNTSNRGNLTVNGASNAIIQLNIGNTTSAAGYLFHDNTDMYMQNNKVGMINFATNATERMRIDSSGNVLVGTTSSSYETITNGFVIVGAAGVTAVGVGHSTGSGSGTNYMVFNYAGTKIGSITQNGTTAVAYNTTSDYRLKENVAPLQGALARVKALKPCTYTWKSAPDEIGEGFIAHELAEVCPQAVTGEKDAVNEDGSIKPQSIDTSFLVATLTAAIQELKAEVDALKAQINQ
jgi:hypothetical protein